MCRGERDRSGTGAITCPVGGGFNTDDFSGKGEGSSTYVCTFPGSMDWDADFREVRVEHTCSLHRNML